MAKSQVKPQKRNKGDNSPTVASPSTTAAAAVANAGKPKKQTVSKAAIGSQPIKRDHVLKDFFVKAVVLISSITLVQISPIPSGDVQKSPSSSLFSSYLAGELNSIPYITQMLLAAAASVFFDIFVVYFHLANPPHPKFVMVTKRKISIYTHLFSGITEIVSGIVAFTVADQTIQRTAAIALALASITHSLTAYYQTGVVFGAKGIMTPGYIYAITIHITFAFRLAFQPSSTLFLIITFLMLHIYVWCRFFVFFFRVFSAFNGYHYTVAITLSGALLFPYALGPIGNYAFLLIAGEYCILEAIFSEKRGKDLARKLFAEHERYALLTEDSIQAWKEQLAQSSAGNPDEKMAKEVFDSYDRDGTGKLGVNELQDMLKTLGDKRTVTKLLEMADVDNNGTISFEEFYRFIWNAGNHHLPKRSASAQPTSERDQAKVVFDMLDSDKSGFVDVVELEMLLTQWGMPEGEADAYMATQVDKKQISFESFYKNLKPLWSFAVGQVFEA
eukprot:TRINITY_DN3188_c0_g1_i2.p1 TRINITY_DN3188_c0_g1~~TRINITY_DN3188_c0_g1_i2.p1  ORF type:complete len:514 (-),score=77.12 TRINITY_DN3188_c0_g1_i2:31-1536(-)